MLWGVEASLMHVHTHSWVWTLPPYPPTELGQGGLQAWELEDALAYPKDIGTRRRNDSKSLWEAEDVWRVTKPSEPELAPELALEPEISCLRTKGGRKVEPGAGNGHWEQRALRFLTCLKWRAVVLGGPLSWGLGGAGGCGLPEGGPGGPQNAAGCRPPRPSLPSCPSLLIFFRVTVLSPLPSPSQQSVWASLAPPPWI